MAERPRLTAEEFLFVELGTGMLGCERDCIEMRGGQLFHSTYRISSESEKNTYTPRLTGYSLSLFPF